MDEMATLMLAEFNMETRLPAGGTRCGSSARAGALRAAETGL